MKTVVGIDISKKYFDAFINNKVQRFQNNNEGISKFVKLLPGESHCLMESTSTYCYSLAKEILNSGNFAYIVNPLKISYFSKMGLSKAKTDRRDAAMIAKFGEMNLDELSPYHFASDDLEAAKQIQTVLEQLKKQRTALLNQLEAIECYPIRSKDAIKALKKLISILEQQIKELEKEAKKLVTTEHREMASNISSIKGIGEDTAVFLISITKGFFSFKNARQLSSFFGCSPRIVESGSSVRGRGT
ncbi:MAG: IS110 family transposase, partial [Bacteroidales bacterium]|nr:IS110 family transposase [Bacteroidales bacterium]